jgi:hypothetical protein
VGVARDARAEKREHDPNDVERPPHPRSLHHDRPHARAHAHAHADQCGDHALFLGAICTESSLAPVKDQDTGLRVRFSGRRARGKMDARAPAA